MDRLRRIREGEAKSTAAGECVCVCLCVYVCVYMRLVMNFCLGSKGEGKVNLLRKRSVGGEVCASVSVCKS